MARPDMARKGLMDVAHVSSVQFEKQTKLGEKITITVCNYSHQTDRRFTSKGHILLSCTSRMLESMFIHNVAS